MKITNIVSALTQKIYFKYIEKFNAGKIVKFNTNANGEEILKKLSEISGHDRIVKLKKEIIDGKTIETPLLNVLSLSDYFRIVKEDNKKIFSKTINRFFIKANYIIHPTSLILLSYLDLLKCIKKDDNMRIMESTVSEINDMKVNKKQDYIQIIEDSKIEYSELLDKCYDFVQNLDESKIIEVPSANVLGIQGINNIDIFDRDIFKYLATSSLQGNLITEDRYFLEESSFQNMSYSTLSLIIILALQEVISFEELKKAIIDLENINYNLYVDYGIYKGLLEKSDNPTIAEIINILQKHQEYHSQ